MSFLLVSVVYFLYTKFRTELVLVKIEFYALCSASIPFVIQFVILRTAKNAPRPPFPWILENIFHFSYLFFLIFFFTVLSKYDKEMRNLLKTDKLAQENSEIFGTVLSFLDDFIWISALIVAIEVVVALLAARSLLTDGNINWFIRTRFYAVLGFIFTAPACIIVCTVRPLKKLAEIPIGHKTLWWLITGCLTVLIFTYSKQIFDERIFPHEKRDVTKDEKTAPEEEPRDLSQDKFSTSRRKLAQSYL